MPDPVIEDIQEDVEDTTLEMSDEDFEKLLAPDFVNPQEKADSELEIVAKEEAVVPTGEEDLKLEADPGKVEGAPAVLPEKKQEADGSQLPAKPAVDPEKKADPDPVSVDFETEYSKIMAPFKANGSEMKVKSVDDVRQLMEMGANYHKKMSGLKPSLKTLKLLEKNNLLDPDKINFLIDLSNKNPEAITKLLKDAAIDPLDLNVKADSKYTPTKRTVADTELTLDSVLEDIRETPSYARTLNVVTKEWDDSSRDAIATEPHIISIINRHIADGTFDTVMESVTYERNLGRLVGISDFDAYLRTGDMLASAGRLQVGPPAQNQVVIPQTSAIPDKKEIERQQKKKAASPVQGAKTTVAASFDPMSMSDEEFAKFDINQFLKKK